MVGVTAIAGTVFNLKESAVSSLCLILAVGLIIGSVLAPRVMHRAYPAGLPILGAMLTGLGLLGAGWSITQLGPITGDEGQRIHLALTTLGPWMLLCGFGGGLWEVPLTVMLQERSAPERRNLVMAGVTVLSNAATIGLVLLMKALISDDMAALVGHPLHYHHAWLMLGGITAIGCAVCLIVYRLQMVGGTVAVLARLVWGIRGHGIEHLPAKGGCLLICNHLSYADGLALAAVLPRQPRFLVLRAYCELPVI